MIERVGWGKYLIRIRIDYCDELGVLGVGRRRGNISVEQMFEIGCPCLED